ncbi:carbohydrate esterase family 9 protein [Agrocybe pediades]|nr:carbohydrate esterase family 9 protein [Agrocybe pediades]
MVHKAEPSPLIAEAIAKCALLAFQAGPPPDFHSRERSDRFEEGTKAVLIQNAKLWTGSKNGTEVIRGDILLDKGLIKRVGNLQDINALKIVNKDLQVIDAKGAWVTPGIVDIHSHLGGASSPTLEGAVDDNSLKGTAQPYLRILDGLNTHDDSYLTSIGGGVTTSLILPGSKNVIGGQAYVIKLRETTEKSPSSMLLEPPYHINVSFPNPNLPRRWRHIELACGENPRDTYDDSRMDTVWALRKATARQIKERQDEYCDKVASKDFSNLGELPEVLEWEALVDVLRGRVKVNVHCYEAVDLDSLVRLSNEFEFPIAVIHHASDAYLVPDLFQRAYGKPPAVALFATMARYKREAYRSSEFAPRILAENGVTVLMKSDHPEMNSRYLLFEAQQAYFYGLPENLAIASVTSNAAESMGMGHRIGFLKPGYDADVVIWDSHPLALGATPSQVFIDGIPQLRSPYVVQKPTAYQKTPKVPSFNEEAKQAVEYEGLPPLTPKLSMVDDTVVFLNVKSVHRVKKGSIVAAFSDEDSKAGVVVARGGSLVCHGTEALCMDAGVLGSNNITFVDLEGGSISPGLVSYGSPLGLENIYQEPSTNDGNIFDPFLQIVPNVLGGDSFMAHTTDGIMYDTRDALLAYRFGVTIGVTAPTNKQFLGGLGAAFSLGATERTDRDAVIQDVTGVHVSVRHSLKPSVSTQIAALRRLLLETSDGELGEMFKKVREGKIPLVVEAHSANIIATLLMLKKEAELRNKHQIRLTITGATEAHILAKELGEAQVGVILNPPRSFPLVWERRRILPGPPFTKNSSVVELLSNGVIIGVGCETISAARNLPFDIAWTAIESGGRFSREQAMAIGSTNLLKLLGVEVDESKLELVASKGGELLSMQSKVAAILSPAKGAVHILS